MTKTTGSIIPNKDNPNEAKKFALGSCTFQILSAINNSVSFLLLLSSIIPRSCLNLLVLKGTQYRCRLCSTMTPSPKY
ncbi:MAG: hypothetical protein JST36_00260 [Bacteroidetes bacterium]|nr:hypothetical protein [Bacteroidota bacterium]